MEAPSEPIPAAKALEDTVFNEPSNRKASALPRHSIQKSAPDEPATAGPW